MSDLSPLLDQDTFDRWCELHRLPWRRMVDALDDDLEAARRWLADGCPEP